jgi:replicative DNA helicase
MSKTEEVKNTFSGYLGSEFQQKLMWQLLVSSEYAERTLENLSVDYFDDPTYKKLFIIMLEYFKEYEKTPSLQNKSINQAINLYKSPNNPIEEESLQSLLNRITLWNERVLNKELDFDGDMVQNATNIFIKQQEYRKLGDYILNATRNGKIKDKNQISIIEEKINKINSIGEIEDYGTEVIEDIKETLRPEFRQTIPTGITVLDNVTGGGLGKGEVGLILSPSGVGKTTILSKIANTAYENEKNVLQIIFEDSENEVKRKHYTIWSKIPLNEINGRLNETIQKVENKINTISGGKLVIKRFTEDNTTIPNIKNWIIRYQKKFGLKFDLIVLDYLDCVESYQKTQDRTEAEFMVIKSFINLAAELNIPAWSATQGNRGSFGSKSVDAIHQGGSIKRIQKVHFVMSIAKPDDMKETDMANIKIIKARFAKDGQFFENCIFNNNTMEIRITDKKYIREDIPTPETEMELSRLDEKVSSFYQEESIDSKLNKLSEIDDLEDDD